MDPDQANSLAAELIARVRQGGQPPRPPVDHLDPRGDDGGMEARITKLETTMQQVQQDLAVIKSNYATREDLHKELHSLTWKLGVAIVLAQLLPALPAMLRAFGWIT